MKKFMLILLFMFAISNAYSTIGIYTQDFSSLTNIASSYNLNISNGIAKPKPLDYNYISKNDDPLLLLHFNGNTKDEISGKTLDCSNCSTYINTGIFGEALKLIKNTKINIPYNLIKSINKTGNFTIGYVVFNKNAENCLIDSGYTWSTMKFRNCEFNENNTVSAMYLDSKSEGKSTFTTGNFLPPKDEWRNVFITYNRKSGNFSYYYNGIRKPLISSITGWKTDVPFPNADLNLDKGLNINGQYAGNSSEYQYLDEFAIFNRTLTGSEIQKYDLKKPYTFNLTSKNIYASSQMYSLNVSWEGENSLVRLFVSSNNGTTWCQLKNNQTLSPFSKCTLGNHFKYKIYYYGNENSKGIKNLKFEWLKNDISAPNILNLTYNISSLTALSVKFKTDKPAKTLLYYSTNNGMSWKSESKNFSSNFYYLINGFQYNSNILFKIKTIDFYGKNQTSKEFSIKTGMISSPAILTVSNNYVENQSKHPRIGFLVSSSSTEWSRTAYQNFLQNPGFELFNKNGSNDFAEDWMSWKDWDPNANFTATADTKDKVSGNSSLKITLKNPGNHFNLKEYLDINFEKNKSFRFDCMVKAKGNGSITLSTGKGGSACNFKKTFSNLSSNWKDVGFNFTTTQNCGRDLGIYFSALISLKNFKGTIWFDNCEMYETTDRNGYGLSQTLINDTIPLRPGTVREGGLGMDMQPFSTLVGSFFNRTHGATCNRNAGGNKSYSYGVANVLGVNELFQYSHMINSNPELVIPWTFTTRDVKNLMEYLFGNSSTYWGSRRDLDGYSSWKGKFSHIVFEMGNELTFWYNPIACYPRGDGTYGSVPNSVYANWAENLMYAMKTSPYWNNQTMEVGFNVQNSNTWGQSQIYQTGKNMVHGGNADFATVTNYVGKVIGSDNWNDIPYTTQDYLQDPYLYYKTLMGWAYSTKEYIAYLKEVAKKFYSKPLKIGFYEYSAGQDQGRADDPLYYFRVSEGSAVAMLDASMMAIKEGVDSENYFALVGGISSSHVAMGDYPYTDKRPAYYALKLYGMFQRGKMIQTNVTNIGTFSPYGSTPNSTKYVGGTQGITQYYRPTNIPYLGVYAFKYNQRYVYFIVNRNLFNSERLTFNIKNYVPSNIAQIHTFSSNSPMDNNEKVFETSKISYLGGYNNQQFQNLTAQTFLTNTNLTNFSSGYTMTFPPSSITAVVNYVKGAKLCLDQDGDGYPANKYEMAGCQKKIVDCNDNNKYINPGTSNTFCNCNFNNQASMGSPEISSDGIDNNCDGIIDNTPISSIISNYSSNSSSNLDNNLTNNNCIPNIQHSQWSTCKNNIQKRNIVDLNNCIKNSIETRNCNLTNKSLNYFILNAKEINITENNKGLYQSNFNENSTNVFYSKKYVGNNSVVIHNQLDGLDYTAQLLKKSNNKYFYALNVISKNDNSKQIIVNNKILPNNNSSYKNQSNTQTIKNNYLVKISLSIFELFVTFILIYSLFRIKKISNRKGK